MKYQVEILIRNLETGATNVAQRMVSVERDKSPAYPHDPLPIDSDQKDSLLRWAIEQATKDAIRDRDKVVRPPMDFRKQNLQP